jgi:uroporphyrin-III C-methyltransferase
MSGCVFLVGAGPGDPELLTLKGLRCLEQAQVVLYDDLVNDELLDYAPANAELIYVGKRAGQKSTDQRVIEALLVQRARAGKSVVRLKGGDPFVFGRGGEEAEALAKAGVPFEVIPGVSAAIAVPAAAGIPVTHRGCASSVAFITGHQASRAAKQLKWRELAGCIETLVIFMGMRNLRTIMNELLAGGCQPDHPVAVIESGTHAGQKVIRGTVQTIGDLASQHRFQGPTLIVVGDVVKLADKIGGGVNAVSRHWRRAEFALNGVSESGRNRISI